MTASDSAPGVVSASPAAPAPTSPTALYRVVTVVVLGTVMAVLDMTIVNVALRRLSESFQAPLQTIQWTVTAYTLALAAVIPTAGWAMARIGAKRTYVTALVLFTLGSLLAACAWDAGSLIAFRAVQGLGGGLLQPVGMAMGMRVADRARLGRAMGLLGLPVLVGPVAGPVLGGWLVDSASWHWIFLINLPIGVAAWLAAVRVLTPEPGAGLGRGADYPGAGLVTGALMLTVYVIVGAGDRSRAVTLLLAALALALFAAFAVHQTRAARPLLRPRLFRSRLLTGANAVQVLMIATMYGFQFVGALYLQRVLGYGALATGTAFLPAPIAIGVLMLGLSARTVARFGGYRVLLAGLVLITAGMALLGRAPADGSYVTDVLPAMLLLSAGFAAAMPALTGLAMSGARAEDAGLASGLFNTTQVVGGSLGLAVLSTLAASRTEALLADGTAPLPATAEGYRLAFTVATGIAAAALALAALVLRERRA